VGFRVELERDWILKKKLTAILVILLALGLVATSCTCQSTTNGGTTGPPEIGKLAPDFELDTLDGQTLVLSQLKGRPVLLNFWATWCGPCRYEMPFLQQIDQEWPEEELLLLTVNIQESSSQVTQFLQSQGLSFTVLLDSDSKVAQRYNIHGIPTTFFIDSGGVIQNIKVGAFQSHTDIEAILDQLD
jgi:thiol-disulfide isomerase/thioredoxin